MLLFGGVLLTIMAPFVNVQFLGSALTFMMVSRWEGGVVFVSRLGRGGGRPVGDCLKAGGST